MRHLNQCGRHERSNTPDVIAIGKGVCCLFVFVYCCSIRNSPLILIYQSLPHKSFSQLRIYTKIYKLIRTPCVSDISGSFN